MGKKKGEDFILSFLLPLDFLSIIRIFIWIPSTNLTFRCNTNLFFIIISYFIVFIILFSNLIVGIFIFNRRVGSEALFSRTSILFFKSLISTKIVVKSSLILYYGLAFSRAKVFQLLHLLQGKLPMYLVVLDGFQLFSQVIFSAVQYVGQNFVDIAQAVPPCVAWSCSAVICACMV